MKYRAEIDGLRAIAILPVVFFHAGFAQVGGGYVGVDVFFVISGYLITMLLLDDLDGGSFSIVNFYERRARRILPALFVVIAFCVPTAWLLLPPTDMKRFADSLIGVSVFSSNIVFWREAGYFDTTAGLKPLLHTWSLAVEEQFYLAYPVLLLVGYRMSKRILVPTIVALSVVSLFVAEFLVHEKPSAAFYLIPTRAWELLLGGLCAVRLRRQPIGLASQLDNVLSAVGLLMISIAVFGYGEATPTPSLYTLLPTVGAALIVLHAQPKTLVGALLRMGPIVGAGLISYSAYLWHQPILSFLRYALQGNIDLVAQLLAIALTFGLGYLSWRFIEAPFRDRRSVSSKTLLLLSITGSVLVLAIGLAGQLTDGFRDLRAADPAFSRDALLQQVRTDRQHLIRAGTCHFDENLPIEDFVAAWNCRSDGEGLFDSRVAVFGDSHAADKAVALRENGVGVWQMTAAGCQLAPEAITDDRKYCHRLFHLFEAHKSSLKGIVVAGRFAAHDLSDTYVDEILRYWGGVGLPVILFAPMPDFGLQQQQYAARGVATAPPSFDREIRFEELIRRRAVPGNITIIKASDYWCPGGACTVADDGGYLMTDEDHLSGSGAALFGKRLLDDPSVRALLGYP